MLAKTDDIIYKQMNFWRNQFESRRLIDFLAPNTNLTYLQETEAEKEFRGHKKRTTFKGSDIKRIDEDLTNSNIWYGETAEQMITEEMKQIQKTLMVKKS